MSKEELINNPDRVLARLKCIKIHIKDVIYYRTKYNSKDRVRRHLFYIQEDIIEALKIIEKELKDEQK